MHELPAQPEVGYIGNPFGKPQRAKILNSNNLDDTRVVEEAVLHPVQCKVSINQKNTLLIKQLKYLFGHKQ